MLLGGLRILKAAFTLPKDYDVYFCEGTYIIPALARKLGLLSRKANIVNILASPLLYYIKIGRIKGIRRKFALWLLKEVDLFVSIGKMEDEILKEILPNAKSIVTYPRPKKEVVNALLKDKRIPDLNSQIILTIGTHDAYYKGIDIVYKAFKKVRRKFINAKLFIVGDMPDLSKYINCEDEGVYCLGYVDNLEMFIKMSSLYVHMGRGDTFPLSTIEAMLCGLPAIVSEWTGTKEIVKEVDKKLIIELSPKELANKIIWYFSLNNTKKTKLSIRNKEEAKNFIKSVKVKDFKEKMKRMGVLLENRIYNNRKV